MDQIFSHSDKVFLKERVLNKLSHLTLSMKKKYLPLLQKRDGENCFYCMQPFTIESSREFDHLDNNDDYSPIENLVQAHHSCNCNKKYSEKMQSKALGKLKMNESSALLCVNTQADTAHPMDLTSCQKTNRTNMQITRQYLGEHTLIHTLLDEDNSILAIVNICQDNNNTGSIKCVKEYIKILSNEENGKYTRINQNGVDKIRRRTEN